MSWFDIDIQWYADLFRATNVDFTNDISDIFLAVITSATEVGNTRPSSPRSESVARIHEVGFYCLTSSNWDDPSSVFDSVSSPAYPDHADALLRDSYSGPNTPNPSVFEHPCSPLTKIISSGTFYYALEPYWDLSSRLQHRLTREESTARDVAAYDERFIWNEFIVKSLLDFRERLELLEREELDRCQFIVRVFTRSLAGLCVKGSVGACHPGLRRRIYSAVTCTSYKWRTYAGDNIFNLAIRLETSRYSLQHERRRR